MLTNHWRSNMNFSTPLLRQIFLLVTILWGTSVRADSLSIMTFNVENMFDARHDIGKDDRTYLPKELKTSTSHIENCHRIGVKRWRTQCLYWDWNETIVDQKLDVVAEVIKQVGGGRGPDIVALQEVENISILERLREQHLAGLGYQPGILLEGKDRRGIDVAFLSRLPMLSVELHSIDFPHSQRSRIGDTRPILEARFRLPSGGYITGFNVHFPAPYHPTKMRESAFATLNAIVEKLPKDSPVFAAGDFNTTRAENSNDAVLEKWVRPLWSVAHDLCIGCPGTNFYLPKKEWSFLDMILWRSDEDWELVDAYLANNVPEQTTENNTPKRFALPQGSGVSDHWPLVLLVETESP